MNRNMHFTPDSASNLFGSDINASPPKSKESINKTMKVKELFNRDLNKSILKLCSEADLRIKVLLSNASSPVTSTSSKFSPKESTSLLHTFTKTSLLETATKSLTLGTSKHSSRKSPKQKVSRSREDASVSCHFNTEIDTIDDQANKQLTVVKILKITDLASKIEKRKNTLIKSKFETTALQRSYLDGLEEGYRYGYFDNPNDELKTQSEITGKTDDTFNDFDKVILKDTELELAERKNKSERMRAGFQDPQQNESRLMNKIDLDVEKKETQIHLTKSSGVTITNEYPSKCDEDVNVEAFNQKYELSTAKDEKSKQTNEIGFTAKDLHGGEQYLQYFEKMLTSVGEDFAKGFRLGFRDGYVAANVFNSTVKTFTEDEKEYISQMRKCLKFSEENLDNDIKKLHARAEEMKRKLNIPADEFEDILQLMQKGAANKKIPLKFSKNDHKYYIDASKRDREYIKIKSTYEDDSDIVFTSYADASDFMPQHTKNRAGKYLKQHRINELFQFLGSHLVANKPEDPISFLINLLEKCIEYRFNECIIPAPLLFTKKHVESVYYVLDPMVTGYIDLAQYVHGMEALGLRDLEDLTTFRPGEKIDKHVFITTACRRLICKFRQMIAMDTITAHPSKVAYTNVEAT